MSSSDPDGESLDAVPARRAPRALGRGEVLSRDEILEAAIDIADRGELDRLTMRRLAESLHVSAMSLYAHIADKDEILDAIIEHRLRERGLPDTSGDWLGWMSDVAERLRRLLVHEPVLLERYCRRPVGVPAALERMEASLGVLRRAGFDGTAAVETFAAVHTYTIGFAALESARRAGSGVLAAPQERPPDAAGSWPGYFASLDSAQFPQLVELGPDLAAFTDDSQFTTGLQALLAGLAARFVGLIATPATDVAQTRPQ